MLTVLGRRKKWKKQQTEATFREVVREESKKHSLEIQGESGFQNPQKGWEETEN